MTPQRIKIVAALVIWLSLIASGLYWWQLSNAGKQLSSSTVAQAQLRATQLNDSVAGHVALLIRDVDFAAQELAGDFGHGPPAVFSGQVRKIVQRFPADSLLQIGVIDAKGYLVYSNLAFNERVFLGDRAHFKAHVGAKSAQLFVSPPVLGRVSKQWSIQFSRPIERGGHFDGVIVISLSPEYLFRTLADLTLGADDSIAIFRQDGEYLARNVDHERALGMRVGREQAFVGADAASSGSFRSTAKFDQVARLYNWQRLNDAPVVVVVGLSESTLLKPVEELLAKNHRHALVATAVLWFFALGAVALLLRLSAQQNLISKRADQLRSDEARLRAIYDVVPVGIFLTDRYGRIIDCNPASERFTGIPKAEQLGSGLATRKWTALRPDGSAMPSDEYASVRALKEGVPIRDIEMQVITPQGSAWLQVNAVPINADGFGVVVAYADITAQKHVEESLRASEARFRTLFEKNSSVMLLVDPASREIVDANASAAAFYGYSRSRLTEMRTDELHVLPPDRIAEEGLLASHEQRDYFIFPHRLADGAIRTVEVHATPITVGDRTLLVSIIHDITQRVGDDRRINTLMREQKAILNSHILGIVKVRNRAIVWANAAFAAMLGYSKDALEGLPTRVVYASDQAHAAFGDAAYPVIQAGGVFRTEVQYQRQDGSFGWYEISGSLIDPDSDESIWALADINERKQMENQVRDLAFHDTLTHLPNRRLLNDRLKQTLAASRRSGLYGAVMFLDLDNFKPLNDAHGHEVGDLLLIEVADRLQRCVREMDTVARFGGDEFVVMLSELATDQTASATEAAIVAEKIRVSLARPYFLSVKHEADAEITVQHHCTASIGVALFVDHGTSQDDILKWADAAMYEAKAAGRNLFRFHAFPPTDRPVASAARATTSQKNEA